MTLLEDLEDAASHVNREDPILADRLRAHAARFNRLREMDAGRKPTLVSDLLHYINTPPVPAATRGSGT